MEILIPQVQLHLEGFMCEVACTKSVHCFLKLLAKDVQQFLHSPRLKTKYNIECYMLIITFLI